MANAYNRLKDDKAILSFDNRKNIELPILENDDEKAIILKNYINKVLLIKLNDFNNLSDVQRWYFHIDNGKYGSPFYFFLRYNRGMRRIQRKVNQMRQKMLYYKKLNY